MYEAQKRYAQTEKGIIARKRSQQTEAYKAAQRRYRQSDNYKIKKLWEILSAHEDELENDPERLTFEFILSMIEKSNHSY
jgi:type II secretory pathway pseudopilin PulG